MGCDVHIITEYKRPDDTHWYSFGFQAINPGRNYEFFTKLSGVRGGFYSDAAPIATSGWPEVVSFAAQCENQIRIDHNPIEGHQREGHVTMERAEEFVKRYNCRLIKTNDGKPYAVTNPDWHSHGHCTIEQMSKALRKNSSPEYRALLAAARSLEKDGMEVRFLFFYDC